MKDFLINMNQQTTWNKIAPLWAQYKTEITPIAKDFLKNKKGKILDLGCGSGRNFVKTKTKSEIYAVDFSEQMLKYAKQKAEQLNVNIKPIKAKAEKLPFENNFFDSALAIAVFHCIDSSAQRKKALKEFYRVLKPNAQALITVWDKQARRFKNKPKNMKVPWTIKGNKIYRNYYLYDYGEFKRELENVGFKIIKRIEPSSNIIVVVEK
jgi:demethylmenaquinone methyltransferase/2-methoxy-6-polyprenyl-1,4-benzoquinol methylase